MERNKIGRWSMMRQAAVLLAAGLALAGCAGAKVGSAASGSGSGGSCRINIAVNPWVGYEANAAVISYVAEKKLGCQVAKKDLKAEVSWQGFGTGEVDAIVENWRHPELKKKYIDEQHAAVSAGSTGVQGVIGWFVPPWMAKQYPDITDYHNLNKYAALFKTSESGDQGQLLDGDSSYQTNDAALVKNLNLNFKVVLGGSEAALIQAYKQAEAHRTPLLAYFYEPQWLFAEVPLVQVHLPAYTDGCDANPEKVACDYPPYDLDKIVSKKFADGNSPGYKLIKNFQWTNEDQNAVAQDIAENKTSPDAAAKKWVDAHPDKVNAWLANT